LPSSLLAFFALEQTLTNREFGSAISATRQAAEMAQKGAPRLDRHLSAHSLDSR
jgi:hypothetical protein